MLNFFVVRHKIDIFFIYFVQVAFEQNSTINVTTNISQEKPIDSNFIFSLFILLFLINWRFFYIPSVLFCTWIGRLNTLDIGSKCKFKTRVNDP